MGMILTLGILLLALAGVVLFFVRRDRTKPGRRNSAAEGRIAPALGPDAAWVTRLTDRIPTVIRRVADAPPTTGAEARSGLGLQGNLAQTPLHDLLQFLALGRKSGTLELTSGRRTGKLILIGGKIAKSAYRGKEGLDAAFLMLDLPVGDFEFYEMSPGQLVGEAGGQAPNEVVDLIMHWMARKPRKKQASTG